MFQFLHKAHSLRPDALTVWNDPEVAQRLSWYRQVMIGRSPAKFMLCRKVPVQIDLDGANEEELWRAHDDASQKLTELVANTARRSNDAWNLENVSPNVVDLDSELVDRMLEHCNFCEWDCRVNRAEGKVGFCRLDSTTSVGSFFHHTGEEAPLIGTEEEGGSGTIFFESCNAHCVFCQNWDISQPKTKDSITGEVVMPIRLAQIADQLAGEGAGNINYVGGEPTVDLHTIVNSLKYMTRSVPLIWNSNMYCTIETMRILADLIDLWLPDFKFWNDECARRLMWVGGKAGYRGVVEGTMRTLQSMEA